MSEATVTTRDESDPLRAVAEAMQAAADSVRHGAEQAGAAVNDAVHEALPEAAPWLSKVVYHSSYGLAYGVVFPAMVLARAVPKDNPIVHGFVDGARAAIDMVNEIRPASPVGPAEPAPTEPPPA